MNAIEARRISNFNMISTDTILASIEKACLDGLFNTKIYKPISPETISYFRGMGYKVVRENTSHVIKWDSE